MKVEIRNNLFDNWALLWLALQITIIGIVHFKNSSKWREFFFLFSLVKSSKDKDSIIAQTISLLNLNTILGIGFFLLIILKQNAIGIHEVIYNLKIISLIYVVWHADYFLFWVISGKFQKSQIWQGNIYLSFFGIFLIIFNGIEIFHLSFPNLFILTSVLFLLLFFFRFLAFVRNLMSSGFSWYYFILYFCTVYVVPSVLLSKHYRPHWLELLTP